MIQIRMKNGMRRTVENFKSNAMPKKSAARTKLLAALALLAFKKFKKKYVAESTPNIAGMSVVTKRECAMIVGEKEKRIRANRAALSP